MNRTITILNRNRIILTLMIAAILPLTAPAQKLQVVKGDVECGRVGYEIPVTAKFELRNKGGKKLKIEKVAVSCGCTQVEYPKGDIGAGDKFTVTLTYDARQLGHFVKTAGLYSNGSEGPVYLTMRGVVLRDYIDYSLAYPYVVGDLRTDKLDLEFDDVSKGENPVQAIHIVNTGSKTLTPNLMHLPPYLTAQVAPENLASGMTGKILVQLNSSKLRDFGLTQTSVYLANNPGEKISQDNEMTVSTVLLPSFTGITGAQKQYAPKMELSAQTLNLDFEGKSKKKGEITISNKGRTNLKISSLQMFTEGLKVTLAKRELAPGESTKLKITAYSDAISRLRTRPRVLMITNDPDQPKITITIKTK